MGVTLQGRSQAFFIGEGQPVSVASKLPAQQRSRGGAPFRGLGVVLLNIFTYHSFAKGKV